MYHFCISVYWEENTHVFTTFAFDWNLTLTQFLIWPITKSKLDTLQRLMSRPPCHFLILLAIGTLWSLPKKYWSSIPSPTAGSFRSRRVYCLNSSTQTVQLLVCPCLFLCRPPHALLPTLFSPLSPPPSLLLTNNHNKQLYLQRNRALKIESCPLSRALFLYVSLLRTLFLPPLFLSHTLPSHLL